MKTICQECGARPGLIKFFQPTGEFLCIPCLKIAQQIHEQIQAMEPYLDKEMK